MDLEAGIWSTIYWYFKSQNFISKRKAGVLAYISKVSQIKVYSELSDPIAKAQILQIIIKDNISQGR